jgi:hypothetical protein
LELPNDFINQLLNSVESFSPINDPIIQTIRAEQVKPMELILYSGAQGDFLKQQ